MGNDTLTPEESFDLIKKHIANFKMNYKENAATFLLWGWIISVASFSHFAILKILQSRGAYELVGLLSIGNWTVFILSAFIIQHIVNRKVRREKKVFSHLDNFINTLWMATGASMFVAVFLCVRLDILPPPFLLLIGGIATTTTGLLIRFKPLIIGGIGFFFFSVATTFVSNENMLLITGMAIVFGYLVPGYFLKSAQE